MKKFSLIFFLFFSACSSPSPGLNSCKYVREAVDGDTARLADGRLVRYIGIDTPETRKKINNVWKEDFQPWAGEAKAFNRSLTEGKCVEIETDAEPVDKYGRILGYVFIDGKLVNEELLKQGYAVLYTRPPNIRYSQRFITAQKYARENKKGLWGDYETIDSDSAFKYVGQIRSVQGTVRSTYRSEKCIFLNFGANWKTDFTAVIFSSSLPSFKAKGIDPAVFYKNKKVEVTGRIREYNGPEIIVNIPEEIIVLDN